MTPEVILFYVNNAIGFACTVLAFNVVAPLVFRVPLLNRGQAPNSFIDNGGRFMGLIFATTVFAAGFGLDYVMRAIAGVDMLVWIYIQTNIWATYAVSITFATIVTFMLADLFSWKTKVYVSGLGAALVISVSDTLMTIGAHKAMDTWVLPNLASLLGAVNAS